MNLEIKPGIVFALLGPNGSGKTTLVRIPTTLLNPDKGTAKVGGFDVVREASSIRSLIGLAGQYPAVLEIFKLTDAANRNARTYSGGMRWRLDLADALVANPSILFLDEPTTGY